jgi:hypothetical protein
MSVQCYSSLSIEKRREFKKQILKVKELRQKERAIIEKHLWNPMTERINDCDMVLKNQMTIEQYIYRNKMWSDYMTKFWNAIGGKK